MLAVLLDAWLLNSAFSIAINFCSSITIFKESLSRAVKFLLKRMVYPYVENLLNVRKKGSYRMLCLTQIELADKYYSPKDFAPAATRILSK